jgi:cellulose synthase/poly-beta-1,6-N-acetylglucosamine synthase-like glycosyltransferase
MSRAPDLRLSVIVPAHNGEHVLAESLPALLASDLPRNQWELIVVDDASTDETADVAERHANRVVRLDGGPYGPASARNHGSEVARGEVLAFVDADVCIHADTLRKFLDVLSEDPGLSAVFGAYDTNPRAPGLVSQYRNLLHHYVHASQEGPADTFWAGCGAIRRSVFIQAGRFDARRYPRPQIEDIELGYRVRARGGRILLRPDIQCTHLKRWTLKGMVINDVRDRGLPWMRLLLDREAVGVGTLNVRAGERILTAAMATAVLALAAAPFVATRIFLALAAACLLLILGANLPLLRWFARRRGPLFALGVVPLRLLYYLLNAAVAIIALARHLPARLAGRVPAPAAEDMHGGDRAGSVETDRPVRR